MARLIVEIFGRAWVFSLDSARVVQREDPEPEEEFEHAPMDPHSVAGGQVERGPGADAYTSDVAARQFGFSHGG